MTLPALSPSEAAERRLVTRDMLAARFSVRVTTAEGWTREPTFPAPVALLAKPTGGRRYRLFDADEVLAWATGPGATRPAIARALTATRERVTA